MNRDQSQLPAIGKNKILIFILLLFLSVFFSHTLLSQELSRNGNRLALVIGNSEYQYGGVLKNPVNDAKLMAATLENLGFKVMKKINATKREMDIAILDYWRQLPNYQVALFYYAGHGIQVDGINYILPVDAKLDDQLSLKIEAVNVGEVVSEFESFPDNINVVILDACRDNPYRSWMRSGGSGFVAMPAPSGTVIAFATSAGTTASDGAGANGLYTEKLARQLIIPQRIEDVFINTRNEVRLASNGRQNPQEWSQLTGKFMFTSTPADPVLTDNQSLAESYKRTKDPEPGEVGLSEENIEDGTVPRNLPISIKRPKRAVAALTDPSPYAVRGFQYKEKSFNNLKTYFNGEKVYWSLSKIRFEDEYMNRLAEKADMQISYGKVLPYYGVIAIGSAMIISSQDGEVSKVATIGVGGVAAIIAGIIVKKKGKEKAIQVMDLYNARNSTSMQLKTTDTGIGLVYNF